MRQHIAVDTGLSPDAVSVKATTTEKLGFLRGREEGLHVMRWCCLNELPDCNDAVMPLDYHARTLWADRFRASWKAVPEDFQVDELADFERDPGGEQALLRVSKRGRIPIGWRAKLPASLAFGILMWRIAA